MTVSKQQLINWLELCASTFREHCGLLTDLDTHIGDADHGHNMQRGFEKVEAALPAVEVEDIGTILKTAGMALLSSGGISGPLYGTFFIRAASRVSGKEALSLGELAAMFRAGVDGMAVRGKTQPGDKTLCDVWWPVVAVLEEAARQQLPLARALDQAEQAGRAALKATEAMQARKGRASYLGEGSIGHPDPGATSAMMMVECLKQTLLD